MTGPAIAAFAQVEDLATAAHESVPDYLRRPKPPAVPTGTPVVTWQEPGQPAPAARNHPAPFVDQQES